jgi:hypothetical protein
MKNCCDKTKWIALFVSIGSICMMGFGIWHFFVPWAWNWYSYMDPQATELIVAVRAINVFFSLCLVLFGVGNLLFICIPTDRFARIVMLSMTTILWIVRVIFQVIYPQGSANPILQYGMLAAFGIILSCFVASLGLTVKIMPKR